MLLVVTDLVPAEQPDRGEQREYQQGGDDLLPHVG
jgi:hypothetical protein